MWQNEQQNLDFLDIITMLSFALQLQNTESHKIDALRDEVSKKLDSEIKAQLNRIEQKLDNLLKLVNSVKGM